MVPCRRKTIARFSIIAAIAGVFICGQFAYAQTDSLQQQKIVDSAGQAALNDEVDSAASDSSLSDSAATEKVERVKRDTIDYDASVIEYDVETKILLLSGNGVVRYRDMILYADTIHYIIDDKTFIATGHPMLIEQGDTVVGEAMVYNLVTRRGKVTMASAASADTRYNGEFISKSDSNVYYIEDGDYSSCAVIDSPHYTFYGHRIKVEPGVRAISRPVILNIAGAPSAALPYYILPLKRGRRSGWLRPYWGGNPASGGYLDNVGYYWAPNDYMDYKLAGKVTEFEDVVATAHANYALRYWLGGSLDGRVAQQGDYRQKTRQWSVNFAHNQNLMPDQSFTLSGSGNMVSDKTFYANFSEDTTELLNQNISANLSLNKRLSKINASTSLTWRRTHNLRTNDVSEDLPSASFSLPSRPLIPAAEPASGALNKDDNEPKWFNKIYYSYNIRGLQKRTFNLDVPRDDWYVHRGINHSVGISSPQKIFKYFTISPNFSISQSVFDAYIDTNQIHKTRIETLRDTSVAFDSLWTLVDSLNERDSLLKKDSVRYIVEKDTTIHYLVYDTTYYWSDDYNIIDAESHTWSTGANLSTNLYGIFPIRIFNFAGIRHTLTPSVGYTFYPEIEDPLRYPNFGIPAYGPQKTRQSISISLSNLFQGKIIRPPKEEGGKPEEKKFSIVSGSVSSAYSITEGEWPGKWGNISASANTAYKILNVGYSSSFAVYDDNNSLAVPKLMRYTVTLRPSSMGASGTFWDGDFAVLDSLYDTSDPMYAHAGGQSWRIGFSPSYSFTRTRREWSSDIFDTQKQYHLNASLSLNFTRRWSVSTGGHYNFQTNQFEGMNFAFRCDLECWDLKFNWYPTGWNRGAFRFIVGIKKYPDIHWEHRD